MLAEITDESSIAASMVSAASTAMFMPNAHAAERNTASVAFTNTATSTRGHQVSDIKHAFPSRFPEGVLLESDFSQLEVVGLAALSNDPMLIEDLLAGRDMHTYYTAERLGIPESEVTSKERTITKRMTFQLQYGSGAANMALKLGIKKEAAEAFISAYYKRYAVVKSWQDENVQAVQASARPSKRLTPGGLPSSVGVLESPSGRLYAFYEHDPPPWSKSGNPTFMPTEIKNYPVQGFATGDIMALFRARVYRWWVNQPERMLFLPVNTVHDSVMFDCYNREYAEFVAESMKEIASKLQQEIEDLWDIVCPIPFKIESKAGSRWGTMEKM